MKRIISLAPLVFAILPVPALAEELENFISADRPVPLVFQKPLETPKAVEKYFGASPDKTGRVPSNYATDGSRVYAQDENENTGNSLGIWRIAKQGDSLSAEGHLSVEPPWRISPDGNHFFARPLTLAGGKDHFSCYLTENWNGIWQLDRKKIPEIRGVAFSPDGSSIAILSTLRANDAHIIVLDTATGRTLRVLKLANRAGFSTSSEGALLYGQDAILLPPSCDAEGRLTRVPLREWKVEFVRLPQGKLSEELKKAGRLVQSPDGRWLVVRTETTYAVLERASQTYRLHFEGAVDQSRSQPGTFTPLESVAISPDSRQLVISGGGQHKILDLISRRIIHEDPNDCRCGFFSRDGKVFWRTCIPFTPLDTVTWEALKGRAEVGHKLKITGLAFSPDGKWLASCDAGSMFIWPVEGNNPRAECHSPQKLTWFQSLQWAKDGKRIIGADGRDFLAWKWTPPPENGQRVALTGEKLFGNAQAAYDKPVLMKILSDSIGNQFLCYDGPGTKSLVKFPSKPGVVRHIKLPNDLHLPSIDVNRSAFANDDKEIVFSNNGVHAYNLADDSMRSLKGSSIGDMVAHDPTTRTMICASPQQLTVISEETQQKLWTLSAPANALFGCSGGAPVALSADGRWLTLVGEGWKEAFGKVFLILVDLRGHQVAAVREQRSQEMTSFAFTPDSKKLATGYLNGAIALWDIESLSSPETQSTRSTSDSTAKPSKTQQQPQAPATIVARQPVMPRRWTADKIPEGDIVLTSGKESSTWQMQPDGAAGIRGILPVAGRLFLNSQPVKLVSARSMTVTETGWFRANLEFSASDGAVHVKRQMHVTSYGQAIWTDTLENVTMKPLDAMVDFELNLAISVEKFQTDQKQAVALNGHEVIAAPDAQFLSAILDKAGGQVFAGFCFALNPAPARPRLLWDAATQRLRARHQLILAPFERKIIGHSVAITPVTQSTPAFAPAHWLQGPSGYRGQGWFHPSWLLGAANFGEPPTLKEQVAREEKAGYKARPVVQKDALGFQWTEGSSPFGFASELGVKSGFEVWLDGVPATFMQERADANTDVNRISRAEWGNPSSTISMLSFERLDRGTGTFAQILELTSSSGKTTTARLDLVTVANGPIVALYDSEGKALDSAKPIPPSVYHGTVAIETKGNARPANILSLGRDGGTILPPTLRLVNERVLIATYEIKTKPGEIVRLFHAATQRPLKAYGNLSEAISGWEPGAAIKSPGSPKIEPPHNWPGGG